MDIPQQYTRVFRTYVDAIVAPRLVSFKRILLSSTGWMTSMLDQSNAAMRSSKENADSSHASAVASQNSANDSQNSANDSQNSATEAANTWAAMKAWITAFNTRWLGVQNSDPTKDNNGNPLADGAEYFNETTNHVRVWSAKDNQWHDQDEATEQEMNAAAVSAANAAASNASAAASNASAQAANASAIAANNAAEAALKSINQSMYWMNTWWLGPSAGAPPQDRNSQPLTPGATYYDTNQHKLVTWNGSNWFTVATSDDVANIRQNFVNIDGSNQMTGSLVINPGNYDLGNNNGGIYLKGTLTASGGDWSTSPGFRTDLTGPVFCTSGIRTSYAALDSTNNGFNRQKSYMDFYHSGPVGTPGGSMYLWSDGRLTTNGDIVAGNTTSGSAYFKGKGIWSASADLAENYSSVIDIPKGTIVSISTSDNPEQELDLATHRDMVFGVISTDPGALLNSQIEHGLPVALSGRVPMRILGPVKKGQKIYLSHKAGIGTADITRADSDQLLGFALESSDSVFEHLTEVALRF